MKKLNRMTKFLLATTFLTSGASLFAGEHVIDPDDENVAALAAADYTNGTIVVNDMADGSAGGKSVTLIGNNTAPLEIRNGIVKATTAGKTTTGHITVKSGGELDLDTDVANLVPGQVEVLLGGKLKVAASKVVPQKTTSYLLWSDGLHDIENLGAAAVTSGGTFTPATLKLTAFGALPGDGNATINSETGAISFSSPYVADASRYYNGDADTVTSFGGGGDLAGFTESGGTIRVDDFDDLPAGVTINNTNGSVDFSGVSGGDYHVNPNGYYNVASGQELATPGGFSVSSGVMSVTTLPTLASDFDLQSDGTINLPSGYLVDAGGTYDSTSSPIATKAPAGFYYDNDSRTLKVNFLVDSAAAAGGVTALGLPAGSTIGGDGIVVFPTDGEGSPIYSIVGTDITRIQGPYGDIEGMSLRHLLNSPALPDYSLITELHLYLQDLLLLQMVQLPFLLDGLLRATARFASILPQASQLGLPILVVTWC